MPVYITDPDAFDKIASVEGPSWVQAQASAGSYGFYAFLHEYQLFVEYLNTLSGDVRDATIEDDFGITVNGNAAIYGNGGWNRYFVSSNGEILFSRHHSIPASQARARAAGFHVTGDPR